MRRWPLDLWRILNLESLGEEISDPTVHTFTKISVGSQTDLQVLLAYVKELQQQLTESTCEEPAEDTVDDQGCKSERSSVCSSPHEMVRSPSEMTVPEKVQLFESLSSSDLANSSLDVPICHSVPPLRFNSNGSILSTEDRNSLDGNAEERHLFIPSTPAKTASAKTTTIGEQPQLVEDLEDEDDDTEVETIESHIDSEAEKSEIGENAERKSAEAGMCCSINSCATVGSIDEKPKSTSPTQQVHQSPPIDCNFTFLTDKIVGLIN